MAWRGGWKIVVDWKSFAIDMHKLSLEFCSFGIVDFGIHIQHSNGRSEIGPVADACLRGSELERLTPEVDLANIDTTSGSSTRDAVGRWTTHDGETNLGDSLARTHAKHSAKAFPTGARDGTAIDSFTKELEKRKVRKLRMEESIDCCRTGPQPAFEDCTETQTTAYALQPKVRHSSENSSSTASMDVTAHTYDETSTNAVKIGNKKKKRKKKKTKTLDNVAKRQRVGCNGQIDNCTLIPYLASKWPTNTRPICAQAHAGAAASRRIRSRLQMASINPI
jgi:hypothetical protein